MKKKMWRFMLFVFVCLENSGILLTRAEPDGPVYVPGVSSIRFEDGGDSMLPTVTVRGFLNFRTTVDGTVIVFTPASEVVSQEPTPASIVPQAISPRSDTTQHQPFTKDRYDSITTEFDNEANTDDDRENLKQLKSGLSDFTTPHNSHQQKPAYGPTPSLPQYPTGLVTVLGGTHINDGATTVFETKVIGTYIDGKYAQILQSTSQIIFSAKPEDYRTPRLVSLKPDIVPTQSSAVVSPTPVQHKEYRSAFVDRQAQRRKDDPFNGNSVLQASFKLPDSELNRIAQPTQSLEKSEQPRSTYTLSRRFRPTVATDLPEDENTVPEFHNNNNRRFRYVLPRRVSPTVRLNRFKVKLTMRNDGVISDIPHDNTFDPEEDILEEYDPLQPVDPARVTYQRTTITSEVTLHVGRRKSVRTLTITTSVPRTKNPTYATDIYNDGHDILPANNNAIYATTVLDNDKLNYNIITRTYTTTERMLKTSVIPVLDGNSTSYHTVTESFFILKLITGYKTMPPVDITLLNSDPVEREIISTDSPISALDNLLDGAVLLDPAPQNQILQTALPNGLLQTSGSSREAAVVPLEGSKNNKQLELSKSLLSLGAALQQNPLAAVYLGLQQLNRQATLYSTITKTSTYTATDTIYSTKVVSFYDGRRTRTRTLSESVSTTEKVMTTYTTSVEPYMNTQFFQPQNQLQQLLGNQIPGGMVPPLLPPQPQFSTVTSTYTTVTTATSLSTRIYTLIYNAISTKFRTVTSTSLYETTVTATTTSEVPISVTAPPGGVFPFLG